MCSVILQPDFPQGLYALLDGDDHDVSVAKLLTFEESRRLAFQVLATYGPYGIARSDNWCGACTTHYSFAQLFAL